MPSCEEAIMSDDEDFVNVFTDGACSRNGRDGARAGIGVFWVWDHPENAISQRVKPGRETNQTAEIQAVFMAIVQAFINNNWTRYRQPKIVSGRINKLQINTDSQFLIMAVNTWMEKWKKAGWKKADGGELKNKEDFQDLDRMIRLAEADGMVIKWNYVKAHSSSDENRMADYLAVKGAKSERQ